MPWHVAEDHPECSGYAVVKNADGSLVACHQTRADAEAQVAALYANEPMSRSASYFEVLAEVPNFRSIPMADVEMRETAKGFEFDGLAAPTGQSADMGEFSEEYVKGSFRRYLAKNASHNIPFCHEHDSKQLLGTTRSGRVKLEEDGRGLRTRANVVKTELSERIKALVDSGDVGGMSIGMIVGRGNADVSLRGGRAHRAITNFKRLLDVSTTFDPAYPTTEAQFRTAAFQLAGSPDLLQQVLMGAYPQLEHGATVLDQVGDEEEVAVTAGGDEASTSGAVEQRSIAARKRALQFLVLTSGGITDET